MATDPEKYTRTIEGEQVELDGARFNRVLFRNCQVIYSGGELPLMSGCYFDGCNWNFVGAAGRTQELLRQFCSGGLRPIADDWIAHVRGEKPPAAAMLAPERKQ